MKRLFCTNRAVESRRLLMLCGLAACAYIGGGAAADVTSYALGRYAAYSQTSNDPPAAVEVWVAIAYVGSDTNGEIVSAEMSYDMPPWTTIPMSEATVNLWQCGSAYYDDYGQFMAEFPATTYTFTVDRGLGLESGDVFVPEDLYCPETPFFTGDTFDRLQFMDPAQPFVVTLNGFTFPEGVTDGYISLIVAQDGQAGALLSVALPADTTEYELPADLMLPDTGHSIGITYVTEVLTPGAGFGGTAASAAEFYRGTGMVFRTGPTIPPACPADFNGDGFLDFFDADAFVACFEGIECPPGKDADFNLDGFVDFFDADSFVEAFEAGC